MDWQQYNAIHGWGSCSTSKTAAGTVGNVSTSAPSTASMLPSQYYATGGYVPPTGPNVSNSK